MARWKAVGTGTYPRVATTTKRNALPTCTQKCEFYYNVPMCSMHEATQQTSTSNRAVPSQNVCTTIHIAIKFQTNTAQTTTDIFCTYPTQIHHAFLRGFIIPILYETSPNAQAAYGPMPRNWHNPEVNKPNYLPTYLPTYLPIRCVTSQKSEDLKSR